MWWCYTAIAGLSTAGTIVIVRSAYRYNEHRSDNPGALDRIKTIHHVVRLLQDIGRLRPTEDMVEEIERRLVADGIYESTLIRLSNLHKQYGDDLGRDGYAINMLWSTIVGAIERQEIIIIC